MTKGSSEPVATLQRLLQVEAEAQQLVERAHLRAESMVAEAQEEAERAQQTTRRQAQEEAEALVERAHRAQVSLSANREVQPASHAASVTRAARRLAAWVTGDEPLP
jgi:vacuolar-type H+-ATPase subunit H